jgi:diaminopimelate epimerase
VAPPVVVAHGARLAQVGTFLYPADGGSAVTEFFKLTGSGNDFLFIDARRDAMELSAERIRALCARGTGVGADGVVVLEGDPAADVRIRYVNSDGSPADLCGNATLCTVRLAHALDIASPGSTLRIATDSGILRGRIVSGTPEFDVGRIAQVTLDTGILLGRGEQLIGYAVVGVPHFVLIVDDIESVDVVTRGRALRHDGWAGPAGANVNFLARDTRGGWSMRTYERGVEGETLACGTGAIAAATLLLVWQLEPGPLVRIWTRSGKPVDVTVRRHDDHWVASLRGEGRIVFRGELVDV